jgi:hypothetical protein
MNANGESADQAKGENQMTPRRGSLLWVQCADYRCLAFMDASGKWISVATGKEVPGVLEAYPA